MRICIFNLKGGSGRTSLAIQLSRAYSIERPDARILLADCDPQGSALAWASLAEETPFTVGRGRSPGFDIQIMDMAPRLPDTRALPEADLFLVPTLLDGVAYVVFLRTLALLQEQGKPFLVVANRVNHKRAEHRERLESEPLKNAVIVRERAALATYYAEGRTVFEMTGRHIGQAQDEIRQLAAAIATTQSQGTDLP